MKAKKSRKLLKQAEQVWKSEPDKQVPNFLDKCWQSSLTQSTEDGEAVKRPERFTNLFLLSGSPAGLGTFKAATPGPGSPKSWSEVKEMATKTAKREGVLEVKSRDTTVNAEELKSRILNNLEKSARDLSLKRRNVNLDVSTVVSPATKVKKQESEDLEKQKLLAGCSDFEKLLRARREALIQKIASLKKYEEQLEQIDNTLLQVEKQRSLFETVDLE